MKPHYLISMACLGLLCTCSIALAQPAPAPAAPAKARAGDDSPPPIVLENHDPAVDTVVDSHPTTPAELLRAALLLADLDRLDLAKKYLAQLAASKPDEKALAESAGQIDPALLLRVSAHPDLQPEGAQFASAVLAAAGRMARDPKRMQAQIESLADSAPAVRREAIARILAAHEEAMPALVLTLGNEKQADVQPMVRQILVKIGEPAVSPLVAALETDNPALKVQLIDVLRQIGSSRAVPFLLAPAVAASSPAEVRAAASSALAEITGVPEVTTAEAVKLLTKEIERDFQHDRPIAPNAAGRLDVWRWDAGSGMPVRDAAASPLAWTMWAARLANDLLVIAPGDATAQRLFLVCNLEAASLRAGFDSQLLDADAAVKSAAKLPTAAVEDALAYAAETGRLEAAAAAATILGDSGDGSLLAARDGQIRPLVQAVAQGDRKLRFAAAEAIMKLKPAGAFAGSSNLLTALAFFADSPGVKRALIAHPNAVTASQFGALLAGLGYQADTAGNGRQAYLQATSSGDYELILLSGRIDQPPVWALLQELRRDPRTAALPIALMAEDATGEPERLKSMIAEDDSLTGVFQRPIEPTGLKYHVDHLIQNAGEPLVPAELRQRQALAALGWLKQLNAVSPKDFDLRPFEATLTRAFTRPQTSAAAAELLASIGTHTAQKSLTDLANTATQPLPLRQSAAAAFSRAVRQYGIQLTTSEIRHQYDRYNQSKLEDKATQQLLALMLDAIEQPTKK